MRRNLRCAYDVVPVRTEQHGGKSKKREMRANRGLKLKNAKSVLRQEVAESKALRSLPRSTAAEQQWMRW